MHRYFLDMHKMLFWLCPWCQGHQLRVSQGLCLSAGALATINHNQQQISNRADLCGSLWMFVNMFAGGRSYLPTWKALIWVQIQRNPTWTGLQIVWWWWCTSLERPFLAVLAHGHDIEGGYIQLLVKTCKKTKVSCRLGLPGRGDVEADAKDDRKIQKPLVEAERRERNL